MELLGGAGVLLGLVVAPLGALAAGGLAALMILGLIVRIRVHDAVRLMVPAAWFWIALPSLTPCTSPPSLKGSPYHQGVLSRSDHRPLNRRVGEVGEGIQDQLKMKTPPPALRAETLISIPTRPWEQILPAQKRLVLTLSTARARSTVIRIFDLGKCEPRTSLWLSILFVPALRFIQSIL
jgi:hypothetical protein